MIVESLMMGIHDKGETIVLLLFVSKSLAAKLTHTKCGEEGIAGTNPRLNISNGPAAFTI